MVGVGIVADGAFDDNGYALLKSHAVTEGLSGNEYDYNQAIQLLFDDIAVIERTPADKRSQANINKAIETVKSILDVAVRSATSYKGAQVVSLYYAYISLNIIAERYTEAKKYIGGMQPINADLWGTWAKDREMQFMLHSPDKQTWMLSMILDLIEKGKVVSADDPVIKIFDNKDIPSGVLLKKIFEYIKVFIKLKLNPDQAALNTLYEDVRKLNGSASTLGQLNTAYDQMAYLLRLRVLNEVLVQEPTSKYLADMPAIKFGELPTEAEFVAARRSLTRAYNAAVPDSGAIQDTLAKMSSLQITYDTVVQYYFLQINFLKTKGDVAGLGRLVDATTQPATRLLAKEGAYFPRALQFLARELDLLRVNIEGQPTDVITGKPVITPKDTKELQRIYYLESAELRARADEAYEQNNEQRQTALLQQFIKLTLGDPTVASAKTGVLDAQWNLAKDYKTGDREKDNQLVLNARCGLIEAQISLKNLQKLKDTDPEGAVELYSKYIADVPALKALVTDNAYLEKTSLTNLETRLLFIAAQILDAQGNIDESRAILLKLAEVNKFTPQSFIVDKHTYNSPMARNYWSALSLLAITDNEDNKGESLTTIQTEWSRQMAAATKGAVVVKDVFYIDRVYKSVHFLDVLAQLKKYKDAGQWSEGLALVDKEYAVLSAKPKYQRELDFQKAEFENMRYVYTATHLPEPTTNPAVTNNQQRQRLFFVQTARLAQQKNFAEILKKAAPFIVIKDGVVTCDLTLQDGYVVGSENEDRKKTAAEYNQEFKDSLVCAYIESIDFLRTNDPSNEQLQGITQSLAELFAGYFSNSSDTANPDKRIADIQAKEKWSDTDLRIMSLAAKCLPGKALAIYTDIKKRYAPGNARYEGHLYNSVARRAYWEAVRGQSFIYVNEPSAYSNLSDILTLVRKEEETQATVADAAYMRGVYRDVLMMHMIASFNQVDMNVPQFDADMATLKELVQDSAIETTPVQKTEQVYTVAELEIRRALEEPTLPKKIAKLDAVYAAYNLDAPTNTVDKLLHDFVLLQKIAVYAQEKEESYDLLIADIKKQLVMPLTASFNALKATYTTRAIDKLTRKYFMTVVLQQTVLRDDTAGLPKTVNTEAGDSDPAEMLISWVLDDAANHQVSFYDPSFIAQLQPRQLLNFAWHLLQRDNDESGRALVEKIAAAILAAPAKYSETQLIEAKDLLMAAYAKADDKDKQAQATTYYIGKLDQYRMMAQPLSERSQVKALTAIQSLLTLYTYGVDRQYDKTIALLTTDLFVQGLTKLDSGLLDPVYFQYLQYAQNEKDIPRLDRASIQPYLDLLARTDLEPKQVNAAADIVLSAIEGGYSLAPLATTRAISLKSYTDALATSAVSVTYRRYLDARVQLLGARDAIAHGDYATAETQLLAGLAKINADVAREKPAFNHVVVQYALAIGSVQATQGKFVDAAKTQESVVLVINTAIAKTLDQNKYIYTATMQKAWVGVDQKADGFVAATRGILGNVAIQPVAWNTALTVEENVKAYEQVKLYAATLPAEERVAYYQTTAAQAVIPQPGAGKPDLYAKARQVQQQQIADAQLQLAKLYVLEVADAWDKAKAVYAQIDPARFTSVAQTQEYTILTILFNDQAVAQLRTAAAQMVPVATTLAASAIIKKQLALLINGANNNGLNQLADVYSNKSMLAVACGAIQKLIEQAPATDQADLYAYAISLLDTQHDNYAAVMQLRMQEALCREDYDTAITYAQKIRDGIPADNQHASRDDKFWSVVALQSAYNAQGDYAHIDQLSLAAYALPLDPVQQQIFTALLAVDQKLSGNDYSGAVGLLDQALTIPGLKDKQRALLLSALTNVCEKSGDYTKLYAVYKVYQDKIALARAGAPLNQALIQLQVPEFKIAFARMTISLERYALHHNWLLAAAPPTGQSLAELEKIYTALAIQPDVLKKDTAEVSIEHELLLADSARRNRNYAEIPKAYSRAAQALAAIQKGPAKTQYSRMIDVQTGYYLVAFDPASAAFATAELFYGLNDLAHDVAVVLSDGYSQEQDILSLRLIELQKRLQDGKPQEVENIVIPELDKAQALLTKYKDNALRLSLGQYIRGLQRMAASALEKQGKYTQAIALVQNTMSATAAPKTLLEEVEQARVVADMVSILTKAKKYDEAAKILQTLQSLQVVKDQPDLAESAQLLALDLAWATDNAAAIKAFAVAVKDNSQLQNKYPVYARKALIRQWTALADAYRVANNAVMQALMEKKPLAETEALRNTRNALLPELNVLGTAIAPLMVLPATMSVEDRRELAPIMIEYDLQKASNAEQFMKYADAKAAVADAEKYLPLLLTNAAAATPFDAALYTTYAQLIEMAKGYYALEVRDGAATVDHPVLTIDVANGLTDETFYAKQYAIYVGKLIQDQQYPKARAAIDAQLSALAEMKKSPMTEGVQQLVVEFEKELTLLSWQLNERWAVGGSAKARAALAEQVSYAQPSDRQERQFNERLQQVTSFVYNATVQFDWEKAHQDLDQAVGEYKTLPPSITLPERKLALERIMELAGQAGSPSVAVIMTKIMYGVSTDWASELAMPSEYAELASFATQYAAAMPKEYALTTMEKTYGYYTLLKAALRLQDTAAATAILQTVSGLYGEPDLPIWQLTNTNEPIVLMLEALDARGKNIGLTPADLAAVSQRYAELEKKNNASENAKIYNQWVVTIKDTKDMHNLDHAGQILKKAVTPAMIDAVCSGENKDQYVEVMAFMLAEESLRKEPYASKTKALVAQLQAAYDKGILITGAYAETAIAAIHWYQKYPSYEDVQVIPTIDDLDRIYAHLEQITVPGIDSAESVYADLMYRVASAYAMHFVARGNEAYKQKAEVLLKKVALLNPGHTGIAYVQKQLKPNPISVNIAVNVQGGGSQKISTTYDYHTGPKGDPEWTAGDVQGVDEQEIKDKLQAALVADATWHALPILDVYARTELPLNFSTSAGAVTQPQYDENSNALIGTNPVAYPDKASGAVFTPDITLGLNLHGEKMQGLGDTAINNASLNVGATVGTENTSMPAAITSETGKKVWQDNATQLVTDVDLTGALSWSVLGAPQWIFNHTLSASGTFGNKMAMGLQEGVNDYGQGIQTPIANLVPRTEFSLGTTDGLMYKEKGGWLGLDLGYDLTIRGQYDPVTRALLGSSYLSQFTGALSGGLVFRELFGADTSLAIGANAKARLPLFATDGAISKPQILNANDPFTYIDRIGLDVSLTFGSVTLGLYGSAMFPLNTQTSLTTGSKVSTTTTTGTPQFLGGFFVSIK